MAKSQKESAVVRVRIDPSGDKFITEGYRPGRQTGSFAIGRDAKTGKFLEVRPPKGGTSGRQANSGSYVSKK